MTASAEENGAETTNSVQNAQPSQTDELTKRSLDTSTDASPSPSIRQALGQKMHSFTEVVNENLIAARFGVFSGVCLLTAYSLANTPLFFRFRVVSEIPASYFVRRRKLYGRIISVDGVQENKCLEVSIRHLSPVGQILPKAWSDFFMRISPQAARLSQNRSKLKPEEIKHELLKVRVAGIQSPPISMLEDRPEKALKRLSSTGAIVSCQLLGRSVQTKPEDETLPKKRIVIDGLPDRDGEVSSETAIHDLQDYDDHQVAVCRLFYRPTWQLFPTDIAELLISKGNASVSSSVMGTGFDIDAIEDKKTTKIVDSSKRVQDLRDDVKYMERLSQAEFDAAKKSMGMWSVPEVRESRRDLVEEVEFQAKANIFQKAWRFFRNR